MATTVHQYGTATPRAGGTTERWAAKKSMSALRVLLAGLDVVTIGAAILFGSLARARWNIFGEDLETTWTLHLAVTHGPWIAAVWLTWLAIRGGYSSKHLGAGAEEFNRVLMASLLAAGTVAMTCYLVKYDLSRGFVTMTYLFGVPLLLLGRLAGRKALQLARARGRILNRVVVVGEPRATSEITEILRRERQFGYVVIGACTPSESADAFYNSYPVPLIGTARDVRNAALKVQADTILVAGGHFANANDVRQIAWGLAGTDLELIVAPSLTDVAGPRVHVRPVAGLPLLCVEPPHADDAVRWSKRAFDIVGSLAILIMSIPVWVTVALAMKVVDGGPVLFRQRRVGLGGVQFNCLKFRSMGVDAEAKRIELLHLNESDGPLFKIREDPRVTSVGRVLRRFSLDELPQLVNVLLGDMSLVGPRPPLPYEVDEYGESVGRKLLVRPGMTGLWQVSGRSQLTWDDSVRLDLYYVDNWSFFQDVVILIKTLRAVLGGRGAY